MTVERFPLPTSWAPLVADYARAERAAGAPDTTIETRRQHLSHLARGIGCAPEQVTGALLVEWASGQTWARETRRGRRTTFRAFWSWAVETGRLQTNAAMSLPVVKASKPAPRPLPSPMLEAALAAADDRTRLILRLACELGLRRAEIARVHRDDLQPDLMGWSLLVHGKGGKVRTLPLPDGLARELRKIDGYAFPGSDSGHLSPRWVGKLATRVLPEAWTLHSGRHRFATLAHRCCGDLLVVQDLLGHASPVTTRAYILPDQVRARQVIEHLAA